MLRVPATCMFAYLPDLILSRIRLICDFVLTRPFRVHGYIILSVRSASCGLFRGMLIGRPVTYIDQRTRNACIPYAKPVMLPVLSLFLLSYVAGNTTLRTGKTNGGIDVKLDSPSHTTIWHPLWFFFEIRRNIKICPILWRHIHATFGQKLTTLLVENWSNFAGLWDPCFNANASENTKRRKMRRSTRWRSQFFETLVFWSPKCQKKIFFWKVNPKIQNFQNFQITERFVNQLLVVYQCANFIVGISVFDPQLGCLFS